MEVAAWCALVDAWVHVDCPSRCPKLAARGDLRAEVERLRRTAALTVDDGDLPRARCIFARFDAVVVRFAQATGLSARDPVVVYFAGSLLELALTISRRRGRGSSASCAPSGRTSKPRSPPPSQRRSATPSPSRPR